MKVLSLKTSRMYRRRASIQDRQASTSAYRDATVLKGVFRDKFVIFRRRSKRIAFWNQ